MKLVFNCCLHALMFSGSSVLANRIDCLHVAAWCVCARSSFGTFVFSGHISGHKGCCARVCVGKFMWLLCAVGRLRQVTFDVCLRADALGFCNPMVASRSELLRQYCCLATLYDMTSCIFR